MDLFTIVIHIKAPFVKNQTKMIILKSIANEWVTWFQSINEYLWLEIINNIHYHDTTED